MSDSIKAIHEDTDEYVDLCKKYGEGVQRDSHGPDCYGPHARSLKDRQRKEWEAQRKPRYEPS